MTPSPANTPPAASIRPGRIVRNADARVEPLYPATRLLKAAGFDVERLATEALQTREAATSEAAATLKSAHDEAAAVRKTAFERGALEAATEFTQLLQRLDSEIEKLKARFAIDVQRVAFRFAKAILDVEFQALPERLVQLIEQLLKPAGMYYRVTIHLHPDDVERVRADQRRLARQLVFAQDLQFAADPKLPPHGVRVETEMGSYDGTLDTQIRRLQNHLLPGEPPFGAPAAPVETPTDGASPPFQAVPPPEPT